jgi:hypothetical protein
LRRDLLDRLDADRAGPTLIEIFSYDVRAGRWHSYLRRRRVVPLRSANDNSGINRRRAKRAF